MNTSPLLINESPLQVLPSLAEEIGLNEAIALQQLHYWVSHNQKQGNPHHFHDGRWWSYNTAEEWKAKNFPFWSIPTIKRTFKNLCDRNLVLTAKLHKDRYNHTKWYTIDYEVLNQLWTDRANRLDQFDPIRTDHSDPIENASVIHSSISTETNNSDTYSTTRAKPRKKAGGGSECVSLLDSEGSNAKEIAQWLCSEYWYHQMGSAEPLRFNCTSYLVDACKGHTKETARSAVLAFWEAMLGYVDINQSINKPERFLAMRLKDREPMSVGNRDRVLEYEQEVRERLQREHDIDYTLRWLSYARPLGILDDLEINEEGQFYGFRYADTGEPRNLALWQLPDRYAHLTIDQLMKVAA